MDKNLIKIKQIENLINNYAHLRNIYMSIIVVLTGGIIGLFYNISVLNISLLCIGIFLDVKYYFRAKSYSKKINSLIKQMESFKC